MRTFVGSLVIILVIFGIVATVARRNNTIRNLTTNRTDVRIVDTITLDKSRFIPTYTSIKIGDSVAIINKDSKVYELGSKDNTLILGLLEPKTSKTVTFVNRGTIKIFDIHQPVTTITIQVQ